MDPSGPQWNRWAMGASRGQGRHLGHTPSVCVGTRAPRVYGFFFFSEQSDSPPYFGLTNDSVTWERGLV